MPQVYWLEQCESDLPPHNHWLCDNEKLCLQGLRFAKRRADWRLGRWTAKNAIAAYRSLPAGPQTLAAFEIRPSPSGAPQVFFANQPAEFTVSLSHRAGIAACAIAEPELMLGCDLEVIEPRNQAFVSDYFTPEEQELAARTSLKQLPRLLALLWSAKESALKALRLGLRLDTRCLRVMFPEIAENSASIRDPATLPGWNALRVCYADGAQTFPGWWRESEGFVLTFVTNRPTAVPILLGAAGGAGSRLVPGAGIEPARPLQGPGF